MDNELDLLVRRPIRPTTLVDLDGIDTEAKALAAMARMSGLQDKALAAEVGVDNATFSRVLSGQARFNERQIERFMDACGSELWLAFWLRQRGYDPTSPRRIETDVERENRELREQLDRLQREREVELRLMRDLRVA